MTAANEPHGNLNSEYSITYPCACQRLAKGRESVKNSPSTQPTVLIPCQAGHSTGNHQKPEKESQRETEQHAVFLKIGEGEQYDDQSRRHIA